VQQFQAFSTEFEAASCTDSGSQNFIWSFHQQQCWYRGSNTNYS